MLGSLQQSPHSTTLPVPDTTSSSSSSIASGLDVSERGRDSGSESDSGRARVLYDVKDTVREDSLRESHSNKRKSNSDDNTLNVNQDNNKNKGESSIRNLGSRIHSLKSTLWYLAAMIEK